MYQNKALIVMKKYLALIALIIPLLTLPMLAQVQPTDTDGNGRINLSTLDHLRWVSENSSCWNQDFELDNDIDAGDTRNWNNGTGWSPIGNLAIPFTGDFDGNNYSISGLYFNNNSIHSAEFVYGFFGSISNNTIENIKLSYVNFYSMSNELYCNHYIGALVGKAENSNIINSTTTGSIDANISITNASLYLGGLVGYASNTNISYSNSSVYLKGYCYQQTVIGGLIGYFSGNNVSICYSSNIIKSGDGSSYRSKDATIGGLVGINALGTIQYSYSEINNIKCYGGWNAYVGGLVGTNQDSISNCYTFIKNLLSDANAGMPSVTSVYAGGIVAMNGGLISNCYSIIDNMDAIAHDNLGAPEYEYIGAIAGQNYLTGTLANCIYNIDSSGNAVSGIGDDGNNQTVLGRNTAEMKIDTTYINNGWNFATVWDIDSITNNGYPNLISEDRNVACNLNVVYPNSINPALYKDMIICLSSKKGSEARRNTILKSNYTFSGLAIFDTCNIFMINRFNDTLGMISGIPIKKGDNVVQFDSLRKIYTANLKVKDQKENILNPNISIKWFDASNKFVLSGDSIKNVIAGKRLKYLIEPNRHFKHALIFPDTLEYVMQDGDNNINIQLDSLRLVTISGTIRDSKDSSIIEKAIISISQKVGNQSFENKLIKADSNGAFSAKIYACSTNISVAYMGYLTKNISIDTITTDKALGNIYLPEINGASLDISMSYTYASKAGDSLIKNDYFTSWQDLDFEIFNITKNKAIKDYQLQFPTFVILDTNIAINDSIRIAASNRNKEFKSQSGAARLDSNLYANIPLDFIQNGSVKLSYSSTNNDNNVALIYNTNGKLVKQYNYSGNGYVQTEELPDGIYKVVSMGYSDFFNDIQNLQDLTAVGLVENTDYLLNQVSVSEGVITEQNVGDIPYFDESKLYYTGTGTLVSVNKTEAVVGSYFVLKIRLNFKEKYVDKISNIKLIYNLLENCPFLAGSAMIGRRTDVAFIDNEDRANIQLPNDFNYSDEVRLCVIPTLSGTYKPSVFIQFDLNGKTIKQPLGTVSIKATDIDFSVPTKTAQKNITALGIVYPNSDVIVYDNEVEVGRTKSLANGSWKLNFELNEPCSYSYHDIYAKIYTPLDLEMKTITRSIIYDASWVEISKVTMIYNNKSIEFDFLHPSTKSSTYTFVPSYPNFTFKIDFTKNDPEKVTDVVLNAITAKGKEFPLKATYDQTAKCWIATGKFDSYNLPVNVRVGYDVDSKMKLTYEDLYIPYEKRDDFVFDSSSVSIFDDGDNCEISALKGTLNDFISDVNQKLSITDSFLPDSSYTKINLNDSYYFIKNLINIVNEDDYENYLELVIPNKAWNGFKEFLNTKNDSIFKYIETTQLEDNEFLIFSSTVSFQYNENDSSKSKGIVGLLKKSVSDRLIEAHKEFLDDFSKNQYNKLLNLRERILKMPGNCDAVYSISDVQIWLDELDRIERRFFSLNEVNNAFDGVGKILGLFKQTAHITKLIYAFNYGIVRGWALWGFGMALAAVENNLKSYYCRDLSDGNSGIQVTRQRSLSTLPAMFTKRYPRTYCRE